MQLGAEDFERICEAVGVAGDSREALRHLWVAGRSYGETWQATGIKPGALRTLVSRTKRKLQEHHRQSPTPASPLPVPEEIDDVLLITAERPPQSAREWAAQIRDAMRQRSASPRSPLYSVSVPARGSSPAKGAVQPLHAEVLCLEDMAELLRRPRG